VWLHRRHLKRKAGGWILLTDCLTYDRAPGGFLEEEFSRANSDEKNFTICSERTPNVGYVRGNNIGHVRREFMRALGFMLDAKEVLPSGHFLEDKVRRFWYAHRRVTFRPSSTLGQSKSALFDPRQQEGMCRLIDTTLESRRGVHRTKCWDLVRKVLRVSVLRIRHLSGFSAPYVVLTTSTGRTYQSDVGVYHQEDPNNPDLNSPGYAYTWDFHADIAFDTKMTASISILNDDLGAPSRVGHTAPFSDNHVPERGGLHKYFNVKQYAGNFYHWPAPCKEPHVSGPQVFVSMAWRFIPERENGSR